MEIFCSYIKQGSVQPELVAYERANYYVIIFLDHDYLAYGVFIGVCCRYILAKVSINGIQTLHQHQLYHQHQHQHQHQSQTSASEPNININISITMSIIRVCCCIQRRVYRCLAISPSIIEYIVLSTNVVRIQSRRIPHDFMRYFLDMQTRRKLM